MARKGIERIARADDDRGAAMSRSVVRRDNRLANCLRPERGRRQAAIGQPPEMWLLETDPMLGNALLPETSLPIVQMSAINQVVA